MNSDEETTRIQAWRVLQSELVLDNQWAKVRLDVCELQDGRVIPDYYYWEGSDFAQVFAITPRNEVVLTRQYKHGVKEIVTELPAGLIDSDDETPLATAQRELKEETGYTAKDWSDLGTLNVSSAKSTARAYVFLAQHAMKTCEPNTDANEAIEVFLLKVEEVIEFILRGTIRDSNSLATTFLALQTIGLRR
jgi:8-oxo-dGTP pyrophosphatase MutT (NUDIX family)